MTLTKDMVIDILAGLESLRFVKDPHVDYLTDLIIHRLQELDVISKDSIKSVNKIHAAVPLPKEWEWITKDGSPLPHERKK